MSLVMLVSFTAAQPSQKQNIMNPGQMPGDLLYGLDRASEAVARAVASAPVIGSEELKSKVLANQAEERLSEAKTLAEKNRSDRAEKLMDEYRNTLNKSIRSADRANNTELSSSLENVTSKHVTVLQDVQRKVPEPAKAGIQRAIDNAEKSRKGLEKAREARERAGKGKPPVDQVPGKTGEKPEVPGNNVSPGKEPSLDENRTGGVDTTLPGETQEPGNGTGEIQNSSEGNTVTGGFSEKPDGDIPGLGR